MTSAVIEVGKTYPPKAGKKKATIKTTVGELFGVWPNMLSGFQPGGVYEIEYTSDEYQGKTYHTISRFKVADRQKPSSPQEAKPASQAELEFVSRIVAAGIASQQVDFRAEQVMKASIAIRSIYRELLRQSH